MLRLTTEARKTIREARFIPAIRDRVSRYTAEDFLEQLAGASQLAAALKAAASGKAPDRVDEPAPTTPVYLSASSLRVSCGFSYIANEADLDKWIAALRAKAASELAKGHRISL